MFSHLLQVLVGLKFIEIGYIHFTATSLHIFGKLLLYSFVGLAAIKDDIHFNYNILRVTLINVFLHIDEILSCYKFSHGT